MKQPDETLGRRSRRRPSSADVSHAVFDRTRPYRHLRNPFEPHESVLRRSSGRDPRGRARHAGNAGHEGAVRRRAACVSQGRRRCRRGDADGAPRPRAGRAPRSRTAPRDITLHAVDPERHVPLSNQCVAFAPTSGPPNIMDTAGGRRAGTLRGFLQPDQAVPELRGHPRARRRDRAAGHPGAHPPSGSDARAAHAVRQDSFHLLARPQAGGRQLRADPAGARHLRRGVPLAPLHLHHHQYEFAAAARHSDGRRHHRFRDSPGRCSSSRPSRWPARWRR